jgi:hypothetical protein
MFGAAVSGGQAPSKGYLQADEKASTSPFRRIASIVAERATARTPRCQVQFTLPVNADTASRGCARKPSKEQAARPPVQLWGQTQKNSV